MQLALALGMTADELENRMTSREFGQWMAYFQLTNGGYRPKSQRKTSKELFDMLKTWAIGTGAKKNG